MVQEGPSQTLLWMAGIPSLSLSAWVRGLHRSHLTWILIILKPSRFGKRSEWDLWSSQGWEESEPCTFWLKYVDLFNWTTPSLHLSHSALALSSLMLTKLCYSKPASTMRVWWCWVVRMPCDWSLVFPQEVFILVSGHSQALSQGWPMCGGVATNKKCCLSAPGQPHPLVRCEEHPSCTQCFMKVMKHEKWKIQHSHQTQNIQLPAISFCLSDNTSDGTPQNAKWELAYAKQK